MLSRFSIIITENILTDYWNLTIWFDLTQSPLTRVEHSWIWRIGFVVGPCEGHACSLLLVSDRMKSHAHPLCHEELEMAMEAWRNWMADCLCVVLERIKKKKLSFFMPSASADFSSSHQVPEWWIKTMSVWRAESYGHIPPMDIRFCGCPFIYCLWSYLVDNLATRFCHTWKPCFSDSSLMFR